MLERTSRAVKTVYNSYTGPQWALIDLLSFGLFVGLVGLSAYFRSHVGAIAANVVDTAVLLAMLMMFVTTIVTQLSMAAFLKAWMERQSLGVQIAIIFPFVTLGLFAFVHDLGQHGLRFWRWS